MREIDHDTCLTLLPWYVNRTLPGAERRALDRHLEGCPSCRQEMEACERITRQVEREAAPTPTAHPAQLERLLERIDRGDLDGAEEVVPGPGLRGRARGWLRRTPVPVRWLAAAQAAAILALVAVLAVATPPRSGEAGFRTLSAGAETPSPARIRVVFAPDATEAEVRGLLLRIRAEIVGGPSPLGAYAIALDRGTLAESDESVLALLRSDPRIVLAEPVAGVAGGDARPH